MAMVANTHDWRRNSHRGIRPHDRRASDRGDQDDQGQAVRPGVSVDSVREKRSELPSPGGGAGGGAGPRTSIERTPFGRFVRRLSLWCYERLYGDIRDAREATATNPLIVSAVGPKEAREIAYRSYANVIEDTVVGQGDEPQ